MNIPKHLKQISRINNSRALELAKSLHQSGDLTDNEFCAVCNEINVKAATADQADNVATQDQKQAA